MIIPMLGYPQMGWHHSQLSILIIVLNAMITNIRHKIGAILRSMETKSMERNGPKTRICLIECGCNHGLVMARNGIGLWMRASGQSRPVSKASQPALVEPTSWMTAMMTERMVVVMTAMARKKSMTRLYGILSIRKPKPKSGA